MVKLVSALQFFFLMSLLIVSCKKKNTENTLPTHYKGVLVDSATGIGIVNKKVYLVTWAAQRLDFTKYWNLAYADTNLTLLNTPRGTVDSTITLSGGIFSFPYPVDVTPQTFLDKYKPALGNHDSRFIFTNYILKKNPYNYLDTFLAESPLLLKIKMQKSSPVLFDDLTFQTIDFYTYGATLFAIKQYSMGQKGITNHTVEIPYSKNFCNRANLEFRYYNNGLKYTYTTTIDLQQPGASNLTINY